ncbi:MAG: 50S ribosomal protein L9 [Mycoplasmataceae bacterium]|nr:50S ribosomal protein L9 [Mycoplasmataceae bacterium]
MKVIIIKKYQKYNVDDIVEVSDGFGSNFLIKNGYALPINKVTSKNLETRKIEKQKQYELDREEALELKNKLEALELNFYLKVTKDVVHGSISSKKIMQELMNQGFKLDRHSLPSHLLINSLGITKVEISLFKDIKATLKVNVIGEYAK